MDYKIKNLPESERPRERLELKGAESLSDAELLALIIRSGTENDNAVEVSKRIFTEYEFDELINASLNELKEFNGIGKVKAGQIKALFEFCKRFSESEIERVERIKNYNDALSYFKPSLKHKENECLAMICLDDSNKVLTKNIQNNIIHDGTVNKINVEFRKIMKKALRENATGVILAHNHPGGDPSPTSEDKILTREIRDLLDTVDIKLLDHIILTENNFKSMKEENMI